MKFSRYLFFLVFITCKTIAQTITVNGASGSGAFSTAIVMLSNGNYVVTDPLFDEAGKQDIGAVYLYNGDTHALISTLKGNTPGDRVGGGGALVLNNGNFVVFSANWSNSTTTGVGAVTWVNGATGLNGIVSSSNSLTGSTTADFANSSILSLNNGNYVVRCPNWDNGNIADAGAITWGNGTAGTNGPISTSNSTVGSVTNDRIGNGTNGVRALGNGHYIIISTSWDNGSVADAGAVTWRNGNMANSGTINSANSLVGSSANDRVGNEVTILDNFNYVVISRYWNNGVANSAGAITWCNGNTGTNGVVSSSNSLVGSTNNDQVGSDGIKILSNGNYVIISENWDNGLATNAGAATWASGTSATFGVVGSTNSLVGSTTNDRIGSTGLIALTNGNYVVHSPDWDFGAIANAGAVTLGNGAIGTSGVVTSLNSMVGSTLNDQVGYLRAVPLSNGNYVVPSPFFNFGANDTGAVTWVSGTLGLNGQLSASNSLVSTKTNDVGGSVIALSNGNYVVRSVNWDNGTIVDAGAITWGDGTFGRSGIISSANSLVGSSTSDQLGSQGVIDLNNGKYVVISPMWNNGLTTDVGAVTLCDGSALTSGTVNASNSLIGSSASDQIGSSGIHVLGNNNYVVRSPNFDHSGITNVGATTWVNGATGLFGSVSISNSLIGSTASDQVGSGGVEVLTNNNYVVRSPNHDFGGITNTGAVTWGNGSIGIQGIVSASNSLVGSTANDQVGNVAVIALENGNYVVRCLNYDNGAAVNTGAITWGNGITGTSGVINATNSLVGGTALDQIGSSGVFSLVNGNYVVTSNGWDNGPITNAASVTWGNGSQGTTGTINTCNSLLGNIANSTSYSVNYDSQFRYYLIGKPDENRYYIFNPAGQQMAPHLTTLTTTIAGNSAAPLVTNNCQIIATITSNGASPVSGQLTAKIWLESTQNASFVKRHYEINPATNAQTATGRVTLYFTQNDFNDFNAVNTVVLPVNSSDNIGKENLRILKYPGISSNNSGLPNSYSGSPTTIDPNNTDIVWNTILSRWEVSFDVTGFSGFLVTSQSNPLPINLINFSGKNTENGNELTWKTADEKAFSHFEIERSENGKKFEKIAEVNGTNSEQYNFLDNSEIQNLKSEILYYRLKMVDLDGTYNYSKTINIENSYGENGINIYPNPSTQYFRLSKNTDIESIKLVDFSGKLIKKMNFSSENYYSVNGLPSGIYLLQLNIAGKIKISKIAIN